MSSFEVTIKRVEEVEHHPNADRLDLVRIGDYRCVVGRDQFTKHQLVAYIPEAAVLPEWLIKDLGLEGRLAGKQKNRVKAVKLRQVLSQGLVYPVIEDAMGNGQIKTGSDDWCFCNVVEGQDVTEFLGITKYEPVIPTYMNGEVWNAHGMTLQYDIENIKKWPDILIEGKDQVMFTEKLHGTWVAFGYHPDSDIPIVTSKGLSGKGLAFKFNTANDNNLYVKTYNSLIDNDQVCLLENVLMAMGYDWDEWDEAHNEPFYVIGEIFGTGVQDLTYGTPEKLFRVFDIYVGYPGRGRYLNINEVLSVCDKVENINYVPILYRGIYYKVELDKYTSGKETISGEEACIREGCVVRLEEERYDNDIGRVILKSVSEDYLLRKNGTEFN